MKKLFKLAKYIFFCTIISIGIVSCTSDDDSEEVVLPTDIQISQVSNILSIGDTLRLDATILPETTTDKSLIWLSSDDEVATVDANGLVTCITDGDVVIQATTSNNIKGTTHLSVAEPDFVIPKEMVGYWVGVEFNLKERGSSMIFDEDDIREMFKGLTEETINDWLETNRGLYNYFAKGDGTIEWELDIKQEDDTTERTVVNGVLTNMKNIENAYYATFDLSDINPDDNENIQELYVENGRIKIKLPWNDSFDSIVYYEVVEDSSSKVASLKKKFKKSGLNNLIPEKFRRN